MMSKDEVALLVDRVAQDVAVELGLADPEKVDEKAMWLAYDRLWKVDKLSVELQSDRFKVKRALQDAARRAEG